MEQDWDTFSFGDIYDEVQSERLTDDQIISPSFATLSALDSRYDVEKKIGRGGVKDIYQAYDKRVRCDVAMAMPHVGTEQKDYDAFIHEAWITGQLDHPGIIKIHDAGVNDENIPYFTMDLKTGVSLERIIRDFHSKNQRETSLDNLIDIFIRVCDGIAYAHTKHIMHLDLKPDNIQVGDYGEVVVCDWGLSKIFSNGGVESVKRELLNHDVLASTDNSALIKGTPGYMAPEQISGEGETIASDIYSLGAVLYSLLAGQSPFGEYSDSHDVMKQTISGSQPLPSTVSERNVPQGLESIAMKALALRPEDRYHSVVELRDDIVKFQGGYVTSAEPQNIVKELLFFYRRNRSICWIALCAGIVIVTTVSSFIYTLNRSWHIESIARQKAVFEKSRADEAIALYQQEKTNLRNVENNFWGDVFDIRQVFQNNSFSRMPVEFLTNSLKGLSYIEERHPDQADIKMMKGLVLFIMQRYDEAEPYIMNNEELVGLRPIILDIKDIKYERDKDIVPPAVFGRVIKGLKYSDDRKLALAFRTAMYDRAVRKDFSGYEQVVEPLLRIFNYSWSDETSSFEYKDRTLRLRGLWLYDFIAKDHSGEFHILKAIPIDHLDIRQTTFTDLEQLQGLSIQELDIRQTPIKSLIDVAKISSLTTLIVSPGQFPAEELQKLPDSVKVNIIED